MYIYICIYSCVFKHTTNPAITLIRAYHYRNSIDDIVLLWGRRRQGCIRVVYKDREFRRIHREYRYCCRIYTTMLPNRRYDGMYF